MRGVQTMKITARFSLGVLKHSLLIALISASAVSCQRQTPKSGLDVSDVSHSPVKRQSIGNCWLYATASWAESLHLSATGQVVNLSESYWTYWDWFDKIQSGTGEKIETGGSWWMASRIIRDHGYMIEGDFIPGEADEQMSNTQRSAEASINKALSEGILKNEEDRTEANIKTALNEAFGVDIDALAQKTHPASDLPTTKKSDDSFYTLNDEVVGGAHAWKTLRYPQLYGKDAQVDSYTKQARARILKTVLKAVNAKVPVIMSSMVEFAALNRDNNATFEYDLYIKAGRSSGQGGHLIVLEDYVVDNVPGVGRIGEGDVSDELKEAALTGDVQYLVVKNSWGSNRPERGLSDGYTRFEMKFLDLPLPFNLEHDETDISKGDWYSALSSFVVPPEFN